MDQNKFNWQQPDWPHFCYSLAGLEDILYQFAEKSGQVNGQVNALPASIQTETMIDFMVIEAIKTSEIEGEYVSRQDVWSSIRNHLRLNSKPEIIKDKVAQGISQLTVTVHETYANPLSEAELFSWHRMLLGHLNGEQIAIGKWRTGTEPMQVVSGHYGNWIVHFEAPPSSLVSFEMERFINWFNKTAPGQNNEIKLAPVRAAIAHLYFESIHPFEDGNGRIGRAIAEKALSQGLNRPVLLSLSQTIERNRKAYYQHLERASRANEITEWVKYFVMTVLEAQLQAEKKMHFVLQKTKFYDVYQDQLNERQSKVIQRMLTEGPDGFVGGINAKKYINLTKCSKATATRDLTELLQLGVLKLREAGGRSTSYDISLAPS